MHPVTRLFIAALSLWSLLPAGVNAATPLSGKRIEMVIPAAAGSGLDALGRTLDLALREAKLLEQPLVLNNIGGAAGDVAKAYLAQKKGDPHFLYVDSNRIYQNKILGTTQVGIDEVTPVARMLTEYLVWAVRADSPIRSAREILDKLKADPGSVVFGVGSAPSNDYFNIVRPALAQGVDYRKLRIVVFKSGGDLMTQLLGGHVPVISNALSEVAEQVKAGKVRLLSSSAPEPLGGVLQDIPHWRGMGMDVSILHWRGVFAPGALAPDAAAYWDEKFGKLARSDAWRAQLQRRGWYDAYVPSAVFRKELEAEREIAGRLLRELGFVKSTASGA